MGTSLNPANDSLDNHEWNLVCLDGNWYYTDVTWDDQDEFLFYAYFNITTKQLEENHTITEFREYLPNATASENNYFYKKCHKCFVAINCKFVLFISKIMSIHNLTVLSYLFI